jgi:hypothetical protein
MRVTRPGRVLVVASARRSEEVGVIKRIALKRGDTWLVIDPKTAELLAKENVLEAVGAERVIVYSGRKPEELALKIYKVVTPDIVYICDKYELLKPIVDFLKIAPVEKREC